jgi:hypothetical protein
MAEKSEGEWRGGVSCSELQDAHGVPAEVRLSVRNFLRIEQGSKDSSGLPSPTITSTIESTVWG